MQTYYAILGVLLLIVGMAYFAQAYLQQRRRIRLRLEALPPGIEAPAVEAVGKVRVVPRTSPPPPLPKSRNGYLGHTGRVDVAPGAELSAPVPVAPVAATRAAEPAPRQTELLPEPVVQAANDPGDNGPIPVLQGPVTARPRLVAVPSVQQSDLFASEPVAPPHSPQKQRAVAAKASAVMETQELEPVNALGSAAAQQKMPTDDVEDVIAVHVICRGAPFKGEDLLRCLLGCGLRYGEMSIFHRHEMPNGQGRVLFSMAKAVEPGIFDIENMTDEDIPGVSFFLTLPGVNSLQAYEIMIDSAKRLAFELNGELLDVQQAPLTRQLVDHYRERVSEFERRQLMARKVK